MEELVHWIMIYISNPDGQLIKIPLEFARGVTLLECMDFASLPMSKQKELRKDPKRVIKKRYYRSPEISGD